jgi:two-component system, LytTR family, sensor kinase
VIHGKSVRLGKNLDYYLAMDAPFATSKHARWQWIAFIWFGIALLSAVQNVLVMRPEKLQHSWTRLVLVMVLSWLVWVLATPLVLRLGRDFRPVGFRPISRWLIHVIAFAMISAVSAAWEAMLVVWLRPPHQGPFHTIWLRTLYDEVALYMSLYAIPLVINYILESKERLVRQQIETARLNEQFSKAQLDALRRQIEPHFLFNALHAIAGLVREGRNDAAVTMIARLSEFLRKVVDTSDRHEVPLGEEVQFLQKYLDIQKVRFADRLQLSVDVPEELRAAQVPSLILQPIVENSIKHGIAKQARGGWIRVTASRSSGRLTLSVYNDGPSLPEDSESTQSGIGIANLRSRLRAMFGDAFEFSLRNHAAGVEVLISVPFREHPG